MPDILKFEWIRYSTYNIILDGKKIGVIDPNYSERKKSSVSFEDDFDGNREIAKTRLIRTFLSFFYLQIGWQLHSRCNFPEDSR